MLFGAVSFWLPQKQELGKDACQPQGFYGPLTKDDVKVGGSGQQQAAGSSWCMCLASLAALSFGVGLSPALPCWLLVLAEAEEAD